MILSKSPIHENPHLRREWFNQNGTERDCIVDNLNY